MHIVETIVNNIVRSTTLFVQQHCSFNNIVHQHCYSIVQPTMLWQLKLLLAVNSKMTIVRKNGSVQMGINGHYNHLLDRVSH